MTGEARHAASVHLDFLRGVAASETRPLCVLSAGETTVRVVGTGRGGRNQEFALASVEGLARIAYFRPDTLPEGVRPELIATRHFVPRAYPFAFTNGVQAAWLEVDVESAQRASELRLNELVRRGLLSAAIHEAQRAKYRTIQYTNQLARQLNQAQLHTYEAGALAAAMSGSGSAVFGLFRTRPSAARALGPVARAGSLALLTRTVSRGDHERKARPVLRRV